MYHRTVENTLLEWSKSTRRKPLILNGARQTGKTTVLTQFGKKHFKAVHIFNFEVETNLKSIFEGDLDPIKVLNRLRIEKEININVENDLIFFDEIQSCPKALHSLKYFQERLPNAFICAAGSLLGVNLPIDSFPVGKVDELEIFPLSFYEFLLALDYKILAEALVDTAQPLDEYLHRKLWEEWKLYLVIGGLPEVVSIYNSQKENLFEALSSVRLKQKLLITEYTKDMAKHAGKANSMHLERIFYAAAGQLYKSIDDSVKRFRFSDVVPGISQYSRFSTSFDWLAGAGMIYKVPVVENTQVPLTQHVKESLFKAYIFDVGILAALSDTPSKMLLDFDFGSFKGYVAENFVLQALKASGIGNVYCWQTKYSEIEFLTTNISGVVPIEVKAGNVRQAKSLTSYVRKNNPEKAIVFGATLPRQDGKILREPIYRAGVVHL